MENRIGGADSLSDGRKWAVYRAEYALCVFTPALFASPGGLSIVYIKQRTP